MLCIFIEIYEMNTEYAILILWNEIKCKENHTAKLTKSIRLCRELMQYHKPPLAPSSGRESQYSGLAVITL